MSFRLRWVLITHQIFDVTYQLFTAKFSRLFHKSTQSKKDVTVFFVKFMHKHTFGLDINVLKICVLTVLKSKIGLQDKNLFRNSEKLRLS